MGFFILLRAVKGILMLYGWRAYVAVLAYLSAWMVAIFDLILPTGMFGFGGKFYVVLVALTVVYLVFFWLFDKKQRALAQRIQRDLPDFEEKREAEILAQIARDSDFRTVCYTCHHYHRQRMACGLHLYNRKKEIPLGNQHPGELYCLYWNVFGPGHLLKTVDKRYLGLPDI